MRRYVKLERTATKFDICDVVKKEFREYQTQKTRLPNLEDKVEDKKDEESHEKNRRIQYLYWKYAYGLLDIEQTTDE